MHLMCGSQVRDDRVDLLVLAVTMEARTGPRDWGTVVLVYFDILLRIVIMHREFYFKSVRFQVSVQLQNLTYFLEGITLWRCLS